MRVVLQLSSFGMMVLEGIDPNKDNFVGCGIIHTRAMKIGCLLRLEPNRQAKVAIKALAVGMITIKVTGGCRCTG